MILVFCWSNSNSLTSGVDSLAAWAIAESNNFDKALLGSKLWTDEVLVVVVVVVVVVVGCWDIDFVVESLSAIITIDGSANIGFILLDIIDDKGCGCDSDSDYLFALELKTKK